MMPHAPHLPPPGHLSGVPSQHARHLSPQHARPVPQQYYSPRPGPPAAALPASKRFKPAPPPQTQPVQVHGDPAMTLDDEEDTSRGDMLDIFSPRELAVQRFKQHHEWMEEVLGSAYPVSAITPVDLGLGLRGELESVTKGLLDPPDAPLKKEGGEGEKKSKKEALEEFRGRVEKKMAEMEEEMRAMTAAHRQRMEAVAKTSLFREAERDLRGGLGLEKRVADERRGSAVSEMLEGETPKPVVEAVKETKPVEEVVREVEEKTGRKIVPCPTFTTRVLPVEVIEKMGGVVAGAPVERHTAQAAADVDMGDFKMDDAQGHVGDDDGNTAGGLLDELNAAAEEDNGVMEDTMMADFMIDESGSKSASPGNGGEAGAHMDDMFSMDTSGDGAASGQVAGDFGGSAE